MRPTESSVEGETLPMAIYSQAKGTIRPDFKNFKKESKNPGKGKNRPKEKRRITNFLTKGKQYRKRIGVE